VAGLWDRVNNAFWPSAGAEAFIAGNETARGEVVFCGTGTWSGVTIAPAVTVVKDLGGTLTRSVALSTGTSGDGTAQFVFDDGTAKFSTISAGQAEFNVHGGTVNVPTWIDWGSRANATAVWNQYGGAVSQSGGNFWIGRVNKGTGVYNLYGGTLAKSGGSFSLGQVSGSTGYFNMTNGTFTSSVDMFLGADAGGVGHFTASGGTLNATTLRVGNNGAGTFDQSGGAVNVNAYLFIGAEAKSATGTYTMTGGTLNAPNQPVSVGRYGTGTLDVSGTAVVTASKGVRVGFTNGSDAGTGTLVVTNGGTVATSSIYGGGSTDAQATVLFDGATVRATAAGNIVKDIANVTIGEGGLTIDTTSSNHALVIANSTLAVAPGATPSITLVGGGTLDVSTATIGLASAPASGTSSFDVAVAADGAAATFTGTPALASGVTGWKLIVADNGKRIRAVRKGVTVIVY
jgi:T5SS/PEP-CTERM-associated repeat protein